MRWPHSRYAKMSGLNREQMRTKGERPPSKSHNWGVVYGHSRKRHKAMGKISAELLHYGPVRTEARRLAWETFAKIQQGKGLRPDLLSPKEKENAITVMLWNAGEMFLQRAKFNLGDHQ